MTQFNYLRSKATADRLIKKYGMEAALRRATDSPTDRPCWVVVISYDPHDKATQLTNPTDRQVVMSPVGLENEPPDNEQDVLVTYVQPAANPPVVDEVLPFTCPVKPFRPAGITVLYEFTVRR